MYYHSEDFFNESLILSINDENKFITLENGIIKKDNQPTNDINEKFIAMISLKSKEQFLFFYYDEKTGILIWKIKNKNFDNVNISRVKFPPVLVILDVFLNSLENHVFIKYQDINSSKHIININLVTEEINISKRDIDFEEIELISNNQQNILYKFIRPGHGLSAKIIDVNKKNEKSGAYILYKKRNTPPNKLLISLHGGPESFEFNENRYNGLYRELVYNDFAVCALNYPGSTFQKTKKTNIGILQSRVF